MTDTVFVVVCWKDFDSAEVIGLRTTWESAQDLARINELEDARRHPRTGKTVDVEGISPEPPHNRGRISYRPGLDYDIYEMPINY